MTQLQITIFNQKQPNRSQLFRRSINNAISKIDRWKRKPRGRCLRTPEVHAYGNVAFDTNAKWRQILRTSIKVRLTISEPQYSDRVEAQHPRKEWLYEHTYRIFEIDWYTYRGSTCSFYAIFSLDVDKMRGKRGTLSRYTWFYKFCSQMLQASSPVRTIFSLEITGEDMITVVIRVTVPLQIWLVS